MVIDQQEDSQLNFARASLLQLMKQMINRKTGSETFNNRLISDRKVGCVDYFS